MICPQCQGAQLASEFGPGGITYRCLAPGCECQFKDNPALDFIDEPAPAPARRPVPKAQPVAPIVSQATTAALTPKNILKLARARMRELNKEIARLTALKAERDQIKRLLAAATQTTDGQANVRPFRTKTG